MKFPFVVIPELTPTQLDRFHKHIDSDESGWHRKWTESIWRRHQHPSNAAKSGWRSAADGKRRILHFYDEYDVVGSSFVLKNAYLSVNLTLPASDIEEYAATIDDLLRRGDWFPDGVAAWAGVAGRAYRRGDLRAIVTRCDVHPEDAKRGHATPGYANLGLTVITEGYRLPAGWEERPWRVFFDVGLRKTLAREETPVVLPEALAEHFPAQLELGCGPSIEAGIPHLSNLHRIYGVSHADYGFIWKAKDDAALDVLLEPERKYAEMTDIYRACVVAGATDFYRRVADLHRRGLLVGPVITNNFDCQCADLGLPEMSLRRYDWGPYYPTIKHDPRAKSLLVVGVHADRRLVQMRAREQGLKVLYIDPEAYVGPDGRDIHYPVEAPQAKDLFVRATAHDGMARLHRALEGR